MNDDDGADLTIFLPPPRTEPAKLYLISPQEVGGGFPVRLRLALDAGPVAAVQLWV
jgi:thiamine-phosphate pyrophosphorylase